MEYDKNLRLACLNTALLVAENTSNGKPNLGEALQIAELIGAWVEGDMTRFAKMIKDAEHQDAPRRKCGCGTSKDPDGFCDGSHELLKPKSEA